MTERLTCGHHDTALRMYAVWKNGKLLKVLRWCEFDSPRPAEIPPKNPAARQGPLTKT